MVLGRRTMMSLFSMTAPTTSMSSSWADAESVTDATAGSGVEVMGVVATLRGAGTVGVFLGAFAGAPALITIAGRATLDSSGDGMVAGAEGAGSASSR